jgi:hypothetical protein
MDGATNAAGPAPPRRLWRFTVRSLVFVFVCWQLAVMVVRSPLDMLREPLHEWAARQPWWQDGLPWWAGPHPLHERATPVLAGLERATFVYSRLTGTEQGWGLFGGNLDRRAPFLAARIEFADGSEPFVVRSANEPDPRSFFRVGGARLRKLESCLYRASPEEVSRSDDLPLYQAYVRWAVRRWRRQAPADRRKPTRVVLLKRYLVFPGPDEGPRTLDNPQPWQPDELAAFDPDGTLQP